MSKKLVCLLFVLVFAFSMVYGCAKPGSTTPPAAGDQPATEPEADAAVAAGEPVQLQFYFVSTGNVDDVQLIEDALNAYVEPLIGATVKLNFLNPGSYDEQVAMMIRGGQQIDVMFAIEGLAKTLATQEAFTPLDDLLPEYGQGIIDQVGMEYIDTCRTGGVLYAVPSLKDCASGTAYVYDKAMADELKLDMDSVHSIYDLTPIFEQVKAAYPDNYPFGGSRGSAMIFESWTWDALTDSLGVLMNYGDNTTVVNLFEQDEYRQLLDLTRGWYLNGYIAPDFATSSDMWSNRMKAKVSFGGITNQKPGSLVETAANVGYETGECQLLDVFAITGDVNGVQWAIPVTTVDKVKSMQLLNLIYTDPIVANLLHLGIEGTHYELVDGCVHKLEQGAKFQHNLSWALCNQFITHVIEGNPLNYWDQLREFNASSKKSQAFGFSYDPTNVTNEVTACSNVVSKYRVSLESGSVDPETVLPQFIQDLKDAGIDTIIAEKQAQIDAWLALSNK